MTSTAPETSVRHQIEVAVPVDRAFSVFTEQFDQIKPREHNPRDAVLVESVFEPEVGGAVYDRFADGSTSRWARVLVFEPPRRFVISWDLSPRWQIETDLSKTSEVEVQFIPIGDDQTRVELEHRHLDRHGDGWESERDGVASDGGWPLYLRRFADLVAG